jgi:hypothetical protein
VVITICPGGHSGPAGVFVKPVTQAGEDGRASVRHVLRGHEARGQHLPSGKQQHGHRQARLPAAGDTLEQDRRPSTAARLPGWYMQTRAPGVVKLVALTGRGTTAWRPVPSMPRKTSAPGLGMDGDRDVTGIGQARTESAGEPVGPLRVSPTRATLGSPRTAARAVIVPRETGCRIDNRRVYEPVADPQQHHRRRHARVHLQPHPLGP